MPVVPCEHMSIHQVYDYLLKSFSNIWEIKYGNIGYVAGLVYDLQRYHPDFGVAVIDQVMEDIQIGMEVSVALATHIVTHIDGQENIFKFNQRRLACVKYLGELYMYRAVSAGVIFDTLWLLISFGHRESTLAQSVEISELTGQPLDCLFLVAIVRSMLSTTSFECDLSALC